MTSGVQLHTHNAQVSATPSNVKINAPKIRGAHPAVTTAPSRVPSGGTKALGDRTNSGSYAAAVSSTLITDEKPRTLDVEHGTAHRSSVRSVPENVNNCMPD